MSEWKDEHSIRPSVRASRYFWVPVQPIEAELGQRLSVGLSAVERAAFAYGAAWEPKAGPLLGWPACRPGSC